MSSSGYRDHKRPRDASTPDYSTDPKRSAHHHSASGSGSGGVSNSGSISVSNSGSGSGGGRPPSSSHSYNEGSPRYSSQRGNSYDSNNSSSSDKYRSPNYSSGNSAPPLRRSSSSNSGSTYKEYNPNRSSRGRYPDQNDSYTADNRYDGNSSGGNMRYGHVSRNDYNTYDKVSREKGITARSPFPTRAASVGDLDQRSQRYSTPASTAKLQTPQSDRRPPLQHSVPMSRLTSSDSSSKPQLPLSIQRPVSYSSTSERTPSRQPPIGRSVSTPIIKSPVVAVSPRQPVNTLKLNDDLLLTVKSYIKMLDFACFTSLTKLGIDVPAKGFASLEAVVQKVGEDAIKRKLEVRNLESRQCATPSSVDRQQNTRPPVDLSTAHRTHSTPVHSPRNTHENKDVRDHPGHGGDNTSQVVRKRASRFSDRPPTDPTTALN